ncbi:MAG TPA: histidine kinase N-terminal 7TM domain-containing protein [Methanospirillum sp.]|uniref:histidine kinase N-terminal 7TM domain-containing protein n=1 Tax=Methanospirillum sp. TaxID=45200 RepID=UPI002CF755AA|nr:histidine kinase N-terminal 7TM domain-containing protein [Methanospirillum sp.]HWQ63074.1 histidine kinase N-terminal 7TM domain-containing protein [Methanospirillum sp.]
MQITAEEIVPFLFLLMLVSSASAMICLGLYSRRYPGNPAIIPYQILMFSAAYWALNYALDLSTINLSQKIFLQEIRFIVIPFIGVIDLWLVLLVLHKAEWIRGWRWKALLILPVITVLAALTSRYHTLFRYNYSVDLTGPLPTLTFQNGPLFLVHIGFTYLLLIAGLVLLLLIREESHGIYLKQRILLFGALAFPTVLDIIFQIGGTPIHGVNLAPIFFWIVGIIYVIALFRFGFLDIVPIARSRVIEEMGMPMIVLSTDSRIADLNPTAERLLGSDSARIRIGQDIATAAASWSEFTSFCSSSEGRKELSKQDEEETRIFDASMELLYSSEGIPEGRLILLTDITTQKKLETEIRRSEERWRSIVDGAPFPIVITQISDNKIMFVNQRTIRQFNLSYDDLIGRSTECFYVDLTTRERLIATLQTQDEIDDIEMKMQAGDGRTFWVYASVRKIQYMSRDAFFISFADFTQRKNLEETLTSKNRELELVTFSLTETNKKLNLLSSITRHDILNMVQVISTISEIIKIEKTEPGLQKQIGMITDAGKTIQNLIEFTREYEDLGQKTPVWQNISQTLQSRSINQICSGITLITPERAVEILADPMLSKVFFNLVENSIRHGGNISTIQVSTDTEGETLKIIYEDDGRGIPQDEKLLIFTRGFGRNTGLGLFFIREVLEITGMTITEEGVPGEGVRFVIRVPEGRFRFI